MVHSIVNHFLRKFFLIVLVILKYNKNQLLYSIPLSLYRSVKNTYFIDIDKQLYIQLFLFSAKKKKKIFFKAISYKWSPSIPPSPKKEYHNLPCFQGVQRETGSMKWVHVGNFQSQKVLLLDQSFSLLSQTPSQADHGR